MLKLMGKLMWGNRRIGIGANTSEMNKSQKAVRNGLTPNKKHLILKK
jgi:hypothetical protein